MTTAIVPYSKKIPLSQTRLCKNKKLNLYTTVSWWWYEWLNQWSWSAILWRDKYYAIRRLKSRKALSMHRAILGLAPSNIQGDHADRNSLNNCEDNLRNATRSQNQCNRSGWGKSKYIGVFIKKYPHYIRWGASIQSTKLGIEKRIFLGTYKTQEEAALAYNKKAIEIHGEFANLNIIEQEQPAEWWSVTIDRPAQVIYSDHPVNSTPLIALSPLRLF